VKKLLLIVFLLSALLLTAGCWGTPPKKIQTSHETLSKFVKQYVERTTPLLDPVRDKLLIIKGEKIVVLSEELNLWAHGVKLEKKEEDK